MNKEPIKLNVYYQQMVLACKGWCSDNYAIEDLLRRILSQYLKISIRHTTTHQVNHFLIEILKIVNSEQLNKVYENLFNRSDSISINEMNRRLISEISFTTVKKNGVILIELEYDEDILYGVCE